jgi:hypothetical protein
VEHLSLNKPREEKQDEIYQPEDSDQPGLASQHPPIGMRNRHEQRTGQGKVHDENDQAADVAIVHEFADAGEVPEQQSEEEGYQGKREDGDQDRSGSVNSPLAESGM